MKFKGSLSLPAIYFFMFLNIFACISNFYRMNSYLSTPSWFSAGPDTKPLKLSMRDGNCTCTVDYVPPQVTGLSKAAKLPTLSCKCKNETALTSMHDDGRSLTETSTKLIQFLCPVCTPVEGKYACPPSARTVETVEVAKACPPSVHTVETVEVAKPCPGVPWYADGRPWHFPPKFPSCTMDTCFNYSKCANMAEPLVYTYDRPSPPTRYFQGINESKYWTDDPEKACFFFVFLDTNYPWPIWPKDLPHWNGGMNHVLITYADKWESRNPPGDSIGNASIMGTIVYQSTYRPGFDIPIPLPGKAHMTHLQSVPILQRKYFATFRGTRYLGNFDGAFRSSDEFRGLHNGEDVVVATTCRQYTNNKILEEHPELGIHCDEDRELYTKFGFKDLMNTTFGLAPAGRQPASYRLIEVMSAGAIPVLITDNYVKPLDTYIHWHDCLLEFPTSEIPRIIPALRALTTKDILYRQENCLRIYNEFLKDDDSLMEASMRALKERFMGVFPSFAHV
ncbi:hypothetical protein KC19_11G037500 [Ceratodon purpureus]|uniref:Exostosin GT47 domain-containing protein n=1 Tax=Ceratodon purpureus TaxID=3225 RepID=A0A8T0GCK2_CERPU|nr:hypothetical protein KC19_11G037500 [Ceratodon purpureus]